jgi:hypothetical protein
MVIMAGLGALPIYNGREAQMQDEEADFRGLQAQSLRAQMDDAEQARTERKAEAARLEKLQPVLQGLRAQAARGDQNAIRELAGFDPTMAKSFMDFNEGIEKNTLAKKDRARADGDAEIKDYFAMGQNVKDQESYDAMRTRLASRGHDISDIPELYDPASHSAVMGLGEQTIYGKEMSPRQRADLEKMKAGFEERKIGLQGAESRKTNAQSSAAAMQREQFSQQNANYRAQLGADSAGIAKTPTGYRFSPDGSLSPIPGGPADQKVKNANARPVPAAALQGINGNRVAIKKIDDVIASVRANPSAVGAEQYLPDALRQRLPGKSMSGGITVRAKISDIGSALIHDRSGAVVTASEYPRLKPFIPKSTDTPDAVIQKLQNLRNFAEMESSVLSDTYSPVNGYRGVSSSIARSKTESSKTKPKLVQKSVASDVEAILNQYGIK